MAFKYKDIPPRLVKKVETEVKMLLHASRDCLRNRGDDTTKITFRVQDGYYAEAFGVMRGLSIAGYGYMTGGKHSRFRRQPEHALRKWFDRLTEQVLEDENYGGSNECDFCVEHYGKDGAGRRR